MHMIALLLWITLLLGCHETERWWQTTYIELLYTQINWVGVTRMYPNSRSVAQCWHNVILTALFLLPQDTNLKGRFGRTFLIQRSCVPLSLEYRAASVPGCPQDVNPQLYYPAAHCCSCRRCDTRTHHCVRSSRISHDRCTMTHGSVKSQNQPALETWQNANASDAHAWQKYSCWDLTDQQCFCLLMLL